MRSFAAAHESAYGTKRTWAAAVGKSDWRDRVKIDAQCSQSDATMPSQSALDQNGNAEVGEPTYRGQVRWVSAIRRAMRRAGAHDGFTTGSLDFATDGFGLVPLG
jgi:hypothetical protein